MRYSHVLRAGVCAAALLLGGGAALAQGANYSTPRGGFTLIAVHAAVGAGGWRGGGFGGSHGGTLYGGGFRGGHWAHGYGGGWGGWGWGPDYAYGWDYPYDDYAYGYGDPDNAYGYGVPGAYCQTPETSCELDHPAVAGQPCQCRGGIDQEPGTAQP